MGPYGDRYAGRDDYMAFIAELMPKLAGYAMDLDRVSYLNDGLAYAELSETTELDGTADGHLGGARFRIGRRPPNRSCGDLHPDPAAGDPVGFGDARR